MLYGNDGNVKGILPGFLKKIAKMPIRTATGGRYVKGGWPMPDYSIRRMEAEYCDSE
jgi:hypothetical protein